MSSRLCIVLFVCVTVVTVKGLPGTADSLWSKVSSTSFKNSPARSPFTSSSNGRAFPEDVAVPKQAKKPEPKKVKPVETPKPKQTKPIQPEGKVEKLNEVVTEEQTKPQVIVKTPDSAERNIPIFAKMILGDPANPKLATVEQLRNIDWHHMQSSLELPNKHTMPMVDELLQKTEELLRLFQDIQFESNGFVEDIQKHNENAEKEYIGYYN